jgi:hypothetical protein
MGFLTSLMCCSSNQEDSLLSACLCGLAGHLKKEPTETIALCFGYPKTPCLRAEGKLSSSVDEQHIYIKRLGSVAGPVIQATGRSEFEDGLGSGDFVSGYSYHMSIVRTRLSDHTKQTKFQSQRPNDVETPVPSILRNEDSAINCIRNTGNASRPERVINKQTNKHIY